MIPAAALLRKFLFATLLLVAACGSPQEREAKHIESGKTLYESGDLVKAILEFRNALQINPRGVEARYYVGLILERQGNLPAALAAFQEVSLQDPKHADAQRKLGQYALMGADPEKALLHADKLIAIDPTSAEGHTLRAAALLMEGKYADVEIEAQAALALKPNDPDTLIVLASQRARQKRFDEAAAFIDQGLAADQANAQLWSVKLKLLRDEGRVAEANDVLRKLMAMQPDNPRYVLELADHLRQDGKLPEAQEIFRQAIGKSATPTLLINAYADFLERSLGAQKAIDEVAALVKTAPKTASYDLLLARLNIKAGQLDAAENILTPLIERLANLSDKLDARAELARITQLRGKEDDALAQLNAILKEDSGNRNALTQRASIYFSRARYDDTISDARSLLSEDPTSPLGLSLLAQTYIATNEPELAVATLRSLVTVAPENVEARLKLAGLLATKSPVEAVQHLDAAIALRPDQPELLVSKAQILIYSLQWDKGELIGQSLLANPATAAAGHQVLGEAALVRKDYTTAVSELKQALAMGRDFAVIGPKLTSAQGQSDQGSGSTDGQEEARKMLTDRIAKNPNDADALVLLANLQQREGEGKGAEDLLRRAIAAAPNNRSAYLNLSLLLKQRGDKAGTIAILEQAAKAFPNDSLVAESVSIAYEIAGDYEKARTAYESVLTRWPGNVVASNNLAQLIADIWPADKKQLDRARVLAEPFRNSNNATLIDTLGWVQLRLGNISDATILLGKASSMAPTDQQMLYHYALALSQKKLNDKAKTVLAGALSGEPKFRGVEDALKLSEDLKKN
ncbi:tetratricopeptide repeat protein [Dongia rigui]|uniref:Tetratricopeptide repeat protein n=1 Tax=Dongia rigui TaxID=940149 RepID=A0ABU5DZ58_9PROT|nr:tetratricopeptide repeat protein [Dongia rigui]MDY0872565.1 tetratricopeptide repeat protein [Dongia rigui]